MGGVPEEKKTSGVVDWLISPNAPKENALRETIADALWYLSDHSFTLHLAGAQLKKTMPVLAGDFRTPDNLSSHALGGLREGYIQLKGDNDVTGRHDHFLVNAAIASIGQGGVVAATIAADSMEESPPDLVVNKLGRVFGHRASIGGGGYKSQSGENRLSGENQLQIFLGPSPTAKR